MDEDEFVCRECGAELSKDDEYHVQWGTCDQECHMHLVGMSWSDFI